MTLKNEDFEAVYEALYGKDALAEAKARVREQVLTEALDGYPTTAANSAD